MNSSKATSSSKSKERFFYAVPAGILAGVAFWFLCFRIAAVNVQDLKVSFWPQMTVDLWIQFALSVIGAAAGFIWYAERSSCNALKCMIPAAAGEAVMLCALRSPRSDVRFLALVILCISLSGSALQLLSGFSCPRQERPGWLLKPVFFGVLLLLAAAGTLWQYRAMMALELRFLDWGVFLDCARQLLEGNGFYSIDIGANFLGNHFEVLTILLLVPFAFIQQPVVFFAFNSLLLYSSAYLIYRFARQKGLPGNVPLYLGFIVLLSPSLSALSYACGYGFHENYFFLPILVGIFLLLEKKHYVRAGILMFAGCLIKETIPVTFAALGFVWLLFSHNKKERMAGLIVFAASTLLWVLIVKCLMPLALDGKKYMMLMYYHKLGETVEQVALSPILRPGVFWGELFSVRNVILVLILLAGAGFPALFAPKFLLAAVPALTFIAVQDADWLKTVAMQHHADVLMLFYLAMVCGMAEIRKRQNGGKLENALLFFGRRDVPAETRLNAFCFAALTGAVLNYAMFAPGYFSKADEDARKISKLERFSAALEYMKTVIPPKVNVNSTLRPAAYFLMRNHVYANFRSPQEMFDYLIFEDNGSYENQTHYDLVRGWALQNNYHAAFEYAGQSKQLVLLTRDAKLPSIDSGVKPMSQSEFDALPGVKLKAPPGVCYESKLCRENDALVFAVRLKEVPDFDLSLSILLLKNNRGKLAVFGRRTTLFGRGAKPAFLCRKGDTMLYRIPLSAAVSSQLAGARLIIDHRGKIDRQDPVFPLNGSL